MLPANKVAVILVLSLEFLNQSRIIARVLQDGCVHEIVRELIGLIMLLVEVDEALLRGLHKSQAHHGRGQVEVRHVLHCCGWHKEEEEVEEKWCVSGSPLTRRLESHLCSKKTYFAYQRARIVRNQDEKRRQATSYHHQEERDVAPLDLLEVTFLPLPAVRARGRIVVVVVVGRLVRIFQVTVMLLRERQEQT